MLERVVIDGESLSVTRDVKNGPYKIYDNLAKEFSDMKYLVCHDYCSRRSLVGAFDNEEDAENFCALKNLEVRG